MQPNKENIPYKRYNKELHTVCCLDHSLYNNIKTQHLFSWELSAFTLNLTISSIVFQSLYDGSGPHWINVLNFQNLQVCLGFVL